MKTTKTVALMTAQEYQQARVLLKLLVRTRENFQDLRKITDNRIGRKADGTKQNIPVIDINEKDTYLLEGISDAARKQEEEIETMLESILNRFSVYTEWLSKVKGVGANHAAWIIGEIDIHKAVNASKIIQFVGGNPGLVRGQISVEKKKYKPEMGDIIGTLPPTKDGVARLRVKTHELVRGDKKTKDFLCPFNSRLRVALAGRLCDSFIKAQSPYAIQFYYAEHIPDHFRNPDAKDSKGRSYMEKKPHFAGQYGRLDLSEQMTTETKKGGKIVALPWKETTDSHRDRAAKRRMLKGFLVDLYANWRAIEGLAVRAPYAEEYLGKKHNAPVQAKAVKKTSTKVKSIKSVPKGKESEARSLKLK